MANLALITARGGSKRLPGKNIRPLGGKPLIAWTIEAAIKSKCFSHVVVSTDDLEIAELSKKFGAVVPFIRPQSLSTDRASSESVVQHAVTWLEANCMVQYDTVTLLQPTSPFRNETHIQDCFSLLYQHDAEAIVSVSPVDIKLELCNELPCNRSLKGFIGSKIARTQEMKELFTLNGAIYLFRRSLVGGLAKIYDLNSNSFAYVMKSIDSVDIDTELDFKWAEFVLSQGDVLFK